MDKVIIKDLLVKGILGIHEWERTKPRDILLNITLFTDTRKAARTDNIADCVDYSAMAKRIRAHVENAARMTVEALANDLAELCLTEQKVRKVIVRVEKPGAVPEAASVGVEIERAQRVGKRSRPQKK
jgi:FolB domain-containing protein